MPSTKGKLWLPELEVDYRYLLSDEYKACRIPNGVARRRFTEEQIIGVLEQHEAGRKVPELTKCHFLSSCEERKIQLIHIQPGRPMHHVHIGSFNGRLRDECLNANWFHAGMQYSGAPGSALQEKYHTYHSLY